MNKSAFYALCVMLVPLFGGTNLYGQRSESLLEKDWRFTRDDSVEYSEPGYDDSAWQSVTVPHDWAIYGPFSEWNDRQHMAIVQDARPTPWNMQDAREVFRSPGQDGTGQNSKCRTWTEDAGAASSSTGP